MFKRLLVLAVLDLGFVYPAWSQVVGDGSKQEQSRRPENDPPKSLPTGGLSIQVEVSPPKKQEEADQKPYQWHELDAPANAPNLLLFGAAIWAGCLAHRTLKAIKQQTQHLVNAERPWIIVGLKAVANGEELDGGSRLLCEIKNVGKSPAKLLEVSARMVVDSSDEPLPEHPDYEATEIFNERILVPNASITFWAHVYRRIGERYIRCNDFDTNGQIQLLICFGRVKYLDTFDSGKGHETCFSDCALITGKAIGHVFGVWDAAPAAYTRCT